MSLFNTTALNSAEIKPFFSSIDHDYSVKNLASFLLQAEQNFIVQYIGAETFDQIHTSYKAGTVSDPEKPLLSHLQNADIHLALMLNSNSGSFSISDTGYYVSSSADRKPVSDKKMSEFKKWLRETAYQALENAVEYLEQNINLEIFAAYKNSDAHLANRAYLLNSSKELTRYYKKFNNSAFLFSQITDSVSFAERKYIKPVLGSAFYNGLKSRVLAGTLSPAEKLLLREIQRPLSYFAIGRALPGLSVQLDSTGMLISSMPAYGNSENVENKTPATPQAISMLASEVLLMAENDLDELEAYLVENASAFPAYVPPVIEEDIDINSHDSPTYFL